MIEKPRLLVPKSGLSDHLRTAIQASGLSDIVVVQSENKLLTLEPALYVACGKSALAYLQGLGWCKKNMGLRALRGTVTPCPESFAVAPGSYFGVTYSPESYAYDLSQFTDFCCDIRLYKRFLKTGSPEPELGDYRYVPDLSGVTSYIEKKHALTGKPVVLSLDLETEGLHPWYPDKGIVSVSLTAAHGLADVFYALDAPDSQLQTIIEQLRWICSTDKVATVGANLKYDMLWLRAKWGIRIENFRFDTCNAGSLLDENRSNSLNVHTKIYSPELGGYDDSFNKTYDKGNMGAIPKQSLLPYAGGDTDACWRNFWKIKDGLLADNVLDSGVPAKNSISSLYVNLIHPALYAIHDMEYHGVCVDVEKFHAFGAELDALRKELARRVIDAMPGHLIDKHGYLTEDGDLPSSQRTMLSDYLFTQAGLNLKPKQTTEKSGKPAMTSFHLQEFADHPVAGPLIRNYLEWASASKMHSTYYIGFLKCLKPDNRWHPSYIIHKQGADGNNEQDAAGTVTGRGSATHPAFQCVTGDTIIDTSEGSMPIRDLIDDGRAGDPWKLRKPGRVRIRCNDRWVRPSHYFKSFRTDLVRVRLFCGSEFKCTPEHPFMTARNGWVKARDLQVGEYLARPKALPPSKRPIGKPWLRSEDVPRALAILQFAGGVVETPSATVIEIADHHTDTVRAALERVCGGPVTPDTVAGSTVFHLPPVAAIPRPAQHFFDALRGCGRETFMPVLRGTRPGFHYLCELARIISRTGENRGICYIYSENLEFLRDIQREVMFHGGGAGRIVFGDPFQQLHNPTSRKAKTRIMWRGGSAGPFWQAFNLLAPLSTGLDLEWVSGMDEVTGGKYTATTPLPSACCVKANQVVEVARCEPGYVYDVTIPETSAFTANGFLVHNTVPKHSAWGKKLRDCIIAPEGKVIVGADYSQGELKVTACRARAYSMIDAYKSGRDLHILTAATVNGLTYHDAIARGKTDPGWLKALRQNGKAGNFGLIYGMSAYGFMMYAKAAYGVALSLEEAEAMRETFFNDLYPELLTWHSAEISHARAHGYVRSPLGRLRHLPLIRSPIKDVRREAERQAINSTIQGTLGDMMWWAMARVRERFGNAVVPFGNIHDQGLWYVPEDHAEYYAREIADIMENLPFKEYFGWQPDLAFTVDVEIGSTLAALAEFKR